MNRKESAQRIAELESKLATLEGDFPKLLGAIIDGVVNIVCSEFLVLHRGTSDSAGAEEVQGSARRTFVSELEFSLKGE